MALVESLAGCADPLGQRVADSLELLEPGDSRLAEPTGDAGVELQSRKGLGAETGELVLEPADLAPQLSARKPLIASNSKRSERLSFKHVRHKPRSSVDHRPATESENHVKAHPGRGATSCTFSS